MKSQQEHISKEKNHPPPPNTPKANKTPRKSQLAGDHSFKVLGQINPFFPGGLKKKLLKKSIFAVNQLKDSGQGRDKRFLLVLRGGGKTNTVHATVTESKITIHSRM